jgi:hypothetical protein
VRHHRLISTLAYTLLGAGAAALGGTAYVVGRAVATGRDVDRASMIGVLGLTAGGLSARAGLSLLSARF